MLPIMRKANWLLSYATVEGISIILQQMDHRTSHRSGMGEAKEELLLFYDDYQQEFFLFFDDLLEMVHNFNLDD